MPTLKQLETALVNADKAGDEEAARALAAEIKRVRAAQAKPKAPPRQKGTGVRALDFTLDAINEAAIGTAEGAVGAGAFFTDPLVGLIYGDKAKQQTQAQRRNFFNELSRQTSTRPMSVYREVGKTVAPAAAVSRAATMAAPVVKAIPKVGNVLSRVAKATASGGIGAGRTAAETAKLSRAARVGQLAERAAGGALSGAATAKMAGQDVEEGALFGAGLPVVASVLKRIGGFAGDITKLPRLKAAEIIRKALGDKIDEARAAFAKLSPDDKRLAEQVLVDAGVEPDTFFGMGQIAERELQPPGTNPMRATLEDQAQARAERLAAAAGGQTATSRRAGTELGRRQVSEVTGPARDAALDRANVAGRVVPQAEELAAAARARADEMTATGFVPRMRGLETRSREQLDAVFQNPEFFTESRPVVRAGEIADSAGQRADDAIMEQLRLRDLGRDMEGVVAGLAAEGMTPLRVAPITARIRQMANQPGTRASTLQRRSLIKAANQLDALADANGVIDARDLYQFRKSELGDIVSVLLGSRNQPPSGVKESAAGLMGSVRDMIDNAIENSGGTGWRDYLTRTRQGFEAVNRQELAGKAAQLAEDNPAEFVALMRGQRPKIVEDIMGPGTKQYDISGMALADPRRYLPMLQSADELATLNRMGELRNAGAGSAANLMMKERPSLLARGLAAATLSPFPAVRIGATGAEQVERAVMAPRVQRQIAEAYTSGPAMNAMINAFPAKMRISEQVSTLSPMARNVLAQLIARGADSEFAPVNPETGEVLVGIGEVDGQRYPMYGRP